MNIPVIRNYRRWFNATLGVLIIAWGVGFMRYLGSSAVEFPFWPNILDVVGLIGVGAYFFYRELSRRPGSPTDSGRSSRS